MSDALSTMTADILKAYPHYSEEYAKSVAAAALTLLGRGTTNESIAAMLRGGYDFLALAPTLESDADYRAILGLPPLPDNVEPTITLPQASPVEDILSYTATDEANESVSEIEPAPLAAADVSVQADAPIAEAVAAPESVVESAEVIANETEGSEDDAGDANDTVAGADTQEVDVSEPTANEPAAEPVETVLAETAPVDSPVVEGETEEDVEVSEDVGVKPL